ncbi:uncharacterized protein PG998_001540 [Apiospora kogelbergensis]|uniref:uncharacterized protein n=1 Tax=Apiospora kogelbergensis TaxID=1337665 RepID=UPI003132760A
MGGSTQLSTAPTPSSLPRTTSSAKNQASMASICSDQSAAQATTIITLACVIAGVVVAGASSSRKKNASCRRRNSGNGHTANAYWAMTHASRVAVFSITSRVSGTASHCRRPGLDGEEETGSGSGPNKRVQIKLPSIRRMAMAASAQGTARRLGWNI